MSVVWLEDVPGAVPVQLLLHALLEQVAVVVVTLLAPCLHPCRFLTKPARAWYVQQLLLSYNNLFGQGVMESWVEGEGPEELATQLHTLLKPQQWKRDNAKPT
jgi:hypothetical protein